MYISTPKKYRGSQRRTGFSCMRLFGILILLTLVVIGIGIYQLRDTFRPQMMEIISAGMAEVDTWQATQFAPPAEPTENPESLLISADNYWQSTRIDLALNDYEELAQLLPNNVVVYTRLTEGYLTRGNLEDALIFADATVTADPFSADAWATRSLVYSWEDDFAEGIASAQQALALAPDNVRATAYLGYAYFQAGLSSLALAEANEAIRLDPDHWSGYWIRGLYTENTINQQGFIDYASAQADYERAYTLAQQQNPAIAGVVGAGLGRVISVTNDAQTVTLLNEIIATDSSNREAIYYLGRVYFDQGEFGQAQTTFDNCTDVAPNDVECWYLLGRSLFLQDDQDGALIAFENAVEIGTPFARHYWWAARTHRILGSCASASPYLQTGYSMVIEGGLPAVEEGNAELIDAFDFELDTCRITYNPSAIPTATPESEPEDASGNS